MRKADTRHRHVKPKSCFCRAVFLTAIGALYMLRGWKVEEAVRTLILRRRHVSQPLEGRPRKGILATIRRLFKAAWPCQAWPYCWMVAEGGGLAPYAADRKTLAHRPAADAFLCSVPCKDGSMSDCVRSDWDGTWEQP